MVDLKLDKIYYIERTKDNKTHKYYSFVLKDDKGNLYHSFVGCFDIIQAKDRYHYFNGAVNDDTN